MSINERFQSVIDVLYNGNKRAFAMSIDVAPTVIENVVGKRQGKPSFDVLCALCANANISAEWILRGEGEMMRGAQPSECSSNTSQSTDNTEIEQLRQEVARLKDEKIKLLEKIVSLQDTH